MAPNNLIARVMQWLANEVIVKGLANNAAFQRFAVRSSEHARELSKSAADAAKSLADSQSVAQLRQESSAFQQQARDFASALREEISKASRDAVEGGAKRPPRRNG